LAAKKEYVFSIHAQNHANFVMPLHHAKDAYQAITLIHLIALNAIHHAVPATVKTCVYLALSHKSLEMVTAAILTVSDALMKNAGPALMDFYLKELNAYLARLNVVVVKMVNV
jgi:hypothetical protein